MNYSTSSYVSSNSNLNEIPSNTIREKNIPKRVLSNNTLYNNNQQIQINAFLKPKLDNSNFGVNNSHSSRLFYENNNNKSYNFVTGLSSNTDKIKSTKIINTNNTNNIGRDNLNRGVNNQVRKILHYYNN